jgi:hypothetical protein
MRAEFARGSEGAEDAIIFPAKSWMLLAIIPCLAYRSKRTTGHTSLKSALRHFPREVPSALKRRRKEWTNFS